MNKINVSLMISKALEENSCRQYVIFPTSKLLLLLLVFAPIVVTPAFADDYFNPNALEVTGENKSNVDLSQFANAGGQLPGSYLVDIYLNNNKVESKNLNFIQNDGRLQPELSVQMLKDLGVRMEAFPAFAHLPSDGLVTPIGHFIPGATSELLFNQQRLNISIPQAALNSTARDAVDPALWDEGLPALMVNYNFSGSNNRSTGHSDNDSSKYLNLRSGANLGAWRLRNYSSYTHSDKSGDNWNSIDTYVQRDIQFLKSQLTVGDSGTASDVFDSIPFKGVQLASDDSMLPDSLRGFAPIVRGIAQSNAQVTVRQNGYVIYQTYVPPGAFTISDLYPTSSSGDLEITIREADGNERKFTQPFSAVPIMQREGHLKYTLTGGKYRSNVNGALKPQFLQSTLIYGLPRSTTLYGGGLASDQYQALALGVGHGFGSFGSISLDVTAAKTQLRDDGITHNGQSYRFQYAKDIKLTGTSFTLMGYRYSTSGYYDFQEANENSAPGSDDVRYRYNKRSRAQININQSLDTFGNIFLTGYQQDYWHTAGYERNLSAGYNLSYNSISYSLSYSYIQSASSQDNDRMISFSVQVPLSKWLPNSWANYSLNSSKQGNTSQQAGISGTALAGNNLSYNLQQSYANQGRGGSGSASMDYRGAYGEVTTGYNYGQDSQQINYGLQGGIVAHPYGVTLSQPLGDTAVLVRAPDAGGVSVENNTGVSTDWRGYAIVPYASTYRKNRIALDTQTMGSDIDIDNNTQTVVPTSGALVLANFHTRVGSRVLLTLLYQGRPVPFGATAALHQPDENVPNTGIVDQSGQVYLSGAPQKGLVQVSWGRSEKAHCQASFTLPEASGAIVQTLTAVCQ